MNSTKKLEQCKNSFEKTVQIKKGCREIPLKMEAELN